MIFLDKIESMKIDVENSIGNFVWYKQPLGNSRIKKQDCWEIVKIIPESNTIYLKKVTRKVLTEKCLDEVKTECIVITKKEFDLL